MTNIVTLPVRPTFDLTDTSTLVLDLANPKPKEVVALVETFTAAMKANPVLGMLPVQTGSERDYAGDWRQSVQA